MTKRTKQTTPDARLYALIDQLERRVAELQDVVEMVARRMVDGDYSGTVEEIVEKIKEVRR